MTYFSISWIEEQDNHVRLAQMTGRERIMIRDWLNQFSDRWPEEYADLYNKIGSGMGFQLTILWKYLKWARPDREDATEIYDLIKLLEHEGAQMESCCGLPPVRRERVKYKVDIEEVGDGSL